MAENDSIRAMRQRIEAFQFDEGEPAITFAMRLAQSKAGPSLIPSACSSNTVDSLS